MNHNDPPWAQAGDPNAMGLDMSNMAEDEFADLLNPEYLNNADFSNLSTFDTTTSHVTQHPFGDSLVQSSGQDGFGQPPQFYSQDSRPQTSGPSPVQPYPPHAVGSFGAFPPGQYIQPGPGNGYDHAMRGALPTPNSSELYGKQGLEYFHQQQMRMQQQQRMQQAYRTASTDMVNRA